MGAFAFSCRESVVSSVRIWLAIPRRDWVSRTRTEDTTPARVLMGVRFDGPGFYGSVVQLEPLARRSPFPSPGGVSQALVGHRSSRRSRGVLAAPTVPSDTPAPTTETRRELSTAADDYVSSAAGIL